MAKPYAWSYSKLKAYETCPKRHYEVDIAKNIIEKYEADGPLAWGDRVHKAIESTLRGLEPLPNEMRVYQKWVDKILEGPGELFIEEKVAITKEFQKTTYFAPDVWYRGRIDVLRVDGPVALVADWKTGKIQDESNQLMLMAQCVFAYHPGVQHVRSEFIWLKEDCTTGDRFDRDKVADEWIGILPRVKALEEANATQSYPPKPGKLCRSWCPVTSCIHHGKGR